MRNRWTHEEEESSLTLLVLLQVEFRSGLGVCFPFPTLFVCGLSPFGSDGQSEVLDEGRSVVDPENQSGAEGCCFNVGQCRNGFLSKRVFSSFVWMMTVG